MIAQDHETPLHSAILGNSKALGTEMALLLLGAKADVNVRTEVRCSVLQCVAVCCGSGSEPKLMSMCALRCVAVCCSVLQCVVAVDQSQS